MKIIKADNYQTWYLENDNNAILIDPWLTNTLQPEGSFFIQRRKINSSCLSKVELDKVNGIIITAPFEDHLHMKSINMLTNIPIYTSNIVKRQLIKNKIQNSIYILSEQTTNVNNLNIKALPTSYPYFNTTFSLLIKDDKENSVFHEGHRVNFKYLIKNNIKADVAILTAEESKLFGFIQLGMNYRNTIKAVNLLGSSQLFITGNNPDKTLGFIKKFLTTKSFDINDLSRQINVYKDEGDSYDF
ncbi:MBL fold metallo-hydrolase [Gammaproteobacteria bacterium]|nr:MBL fold metallo-hydrolase [Gammaproteobacteria bacterium]